MGDQLQQPVGKVLTKPRRHFAWVGFAVSTREDRHSSTFDLIPQQERKSAENSSPNFAISLRIEERRLGEPVQYRAKFGVELRGQADLLLLIPQLGFGQIPFCSAANINAIAQGS